MSEDPAFVWNAGRSRPRPMDPPSSGPDTSRVVASEQTSPAGATPDDPAPRDVARSDSVLVPIDEWSRLLHQLGNLHEAGQQLAEARERAAKAETESTFLRERLRETREHLLELRTEIEETPEPEPEPLPAFGEWFVRRWLEKRRRRPGS